MASMSDQPRWFSRYDDLSAEPFGVVQAKDGVWAAVWDLRLAFPQVPVKVLLIKAERLIRAGRMDGCTCGCRGDFTVTGWSAARSERSG